MQEKLYRAYVIESVVWEILFVLFGLFRFICGTLMEMKWWLGISWEVIFITYLIVALGIASNKIKILGEKVMK